MEEWAPAQENASSSLLFCFGFRLPCPTRGGRCLPRHRQSHRASTPASSYCFSPSRSTITTSAMNIATHHFLYLSLTLTLSLSLSLSLSQPMPMGILVFILSFLFITFLLGYLPGLMRNPKSLMVRGYTRDVDPLGS